MPPSRTKQEISDVMRRVKSKDTEPEIVLRRALWAAGIRYRLHDSGLPGKPDIVIPRSRLVIFIDGDYWHGGQWAHRGHKSLAEQFVASPHADYWIGKISGNMRRDRHNTAALLSAGWRALRFWESDIAVNVELCVKTTLEALSGEETRSPASRLPHLTVAEFFAGIGLMRWALERKEWNVVFANDIDPQKHEIYQANFPDPDDHFRLDDINLISGDEVPSVTLATASFPCNDLSLAGGMRGLSGEHSGTFWAFIRILDEMGDRRPPFVLLENVTGWLNSKRGTDFKDSLLALNELGYSCDAFVLNASNFVPQSRPRLFVIGVLQEDAVREPRSFFESEVRPKLLADFIFLDKDIRWNPRELPKPPSRTTDLADIIEDLPDDSPEWWNERRADYFLNQMSDSHRRIAARMISGSDYSYGTAFRRVRYGKSMAELRVDGIAGCLRTPRGGSGRQILFKAGKGEYRVRLLTPRECARLQGVDDSYIINVPANQALFGFGDAVCVPVIEWIADNYLNPLVTSAIHTQVLYPIAEEG